MSDDFVSIAGEFDTATKKAIRFIPDKLRVAIWIPRSLLPGGEDRAIRKWERNMPMEIHVREWFARKENLI